MDNLRNRLDALTLVLKTCIGHVCNHPWKALEPSGDVQSLPDALAPKYDDFYRNQPKVTYDHCPLGYFLENEQPTRFHTYGGNISDIVARSTEEWERWG